MENQMNVGNQNTQQIGQNPVSQPVTIPEKPKVNYLMIGGIILASFVVFGFGGYYLGKQSSIPQVSISSEQNQVSPTTPLPTSSQESVTSPTQYLTSNWEIYTNSKNLYSVKIPPEWRPNRGYPGGEYTDRELQQMDSVSWYKDNSSFSIQVLTECINLDECFKSYQTVADSQGGPYATKRTQTTKGTFQGNISIVARSTYGGSDNTVKGIFFVYKGKLWLLETQSPPSFSSNVEKETDQIISTLKFTN